MDFHINGEHVYIWEIYQYFNLIKEDEKESWVRRTGHSDYRFEDGQQTFDD